MQIKAAGPQHHPIIVSWTINDSDSELPAISNQTFSARQCPALSVSAPSKELSPPACCDTCACQDAHSAHSKPGMFKIADYMLACLGYAALRK